MKEAHQRKINPYEQVSNFVPDNNETLDQILIMIARNEICTDPSFFRMLDKMSNNNRPGSESPQKNYTQGENFDAATALKNKKLIQ